MDQSNIVTKEADNGGAVTVILLKHYRSMIYEHFHNQNTNIEITIIKNLKTIKQTYKQVCR